MRFFWVDAFTAKLFTGNPAGVVPLDTWLPDEHMRLIAFENGLAETAFFVRTGPERFHLRWFTPAVEVNLCGHATLASAFVIFHELGQAGERITFDSRSGPLHVARLPGGELELDFPSRPAGPLARPQPEILAILNLPPLQLLEVPAQNYFLAVYASQADVLALRPDFPRLAAQGDVRVIATAPGEDCDCVSRFFAPGAGVPEDPVTGSAHCTVAPYWVARLGKNPLRARQVSPRGGELHCTLAGDRVHLAGRAALYLRGEILS